MSAIVRIHGREVLDSRGNPTVQVEVWTDLGGYGSAMVPSGASTGENEALELRDGKESKEWFGGKGVSKAVKNVNTVLKDLVEGMEVSAQAAIDLAMIKADGTPFKKNLGANAILGVSLAVARAAADELGMELYQYIGGVGARTLPVPMLNVINGGQHASNTLDFQEFMVMPIGAKNFKHSLQMANHVFHNLAKILHDMGHGTQVGDEGGFAPNFKTHEEALEVLVKAIKQAGYNPSTTGENAVAIAMDSAVSELYDGKQYIFEKAEKAGFKDIKTRFTRDEMVKYFEDLCAKFPIISIEDGMAESDWEGFVALKAKLGKTHQIMGDDLTVTNKDFLKKAIKMDAINSILIKLNQIGTLTETIETINMAHKAGYTAVVSHRSGETEDTTLADLAVALNTGQIKTGSMSRTDRIAKYNRLLAIEEELGDAAIFLGEATFHNIKKNIN